LAGLIIVRNLSWSLQLSDNICLLAAGCIHIDFIGLDMGDPDPGKIPSEKTNLAGAPGRTRTPNHCLEGNEGGIEKIDNAT
jgi:hypothetical protein